jgi:hypothetical protein
LTIDRTFLIRYLEKTLLPEEREQVEVALREDPELRAELADVILVSAAPAERPKHDEAAVEPAKDTLARRLSTPVPFSQASASVRFHAIWAVSVLAFLAAGTTWWGLTADRERRAASPAAATTASVAPLSPGAVLAGLPASMDKATLSVALERILDPTTTPAERQDVYRSWNAIYSPALEPLIWAVAPVEPSSKARATLYIVIPNSPPVTDYPALLQAAHREWSKGDIEPFAQLVRLLSFHPTAETEALFHEVLQARDKVPPPWFAERLPGIQKAFPDDGRISVSIVKAMSDPDEVVRATAGLARASIRRRDGLECAVRCLKAAAPDARRIAIVTIDRHGGVEEARALLPLAEDQDFAVRTLARKALAAKGITPVSNP